MKSHLIAAALLGCLLQTAQSAVLVNWEFNEAANTALIGTANTGTQTGTWEQNLNGVTTNGSGLLVTSATTLAAASNKSAAGGLGLAITANSGIYDMTFTDVRFNNLSGDDYLLFGFRTTATGSIVSSSRERANFKVGDFNGTPGLDLEASTAVTPATTYASAYNVTTDFTGAFTFKLRLDTGTNTATAYYDIGSGLTQLGNAYTISTATTIDTIAMRLIVTDGGAGDSISIGNVSVATVPVPEPATWAALLGVLALGFTVVRRRLRG